MDKDYTFELGTIKAAMLGPSRVVAIEHVPKLQAQAIQSEKSRDWAEAHKFWTALYNTQPRGEISAWYKSRSAHAYMIDYRIKQCRK